MAAVTARTRFGRIMSQECGKRVHLKMNRAVNKSDVRPAILYESEV